jgi:hypothetical protein
MNSHTRTAFQNPQQPMHSRSINHGGTSELQYRKELDAVAHNNALNVQICQAVANSHQNFTQPPSQPPKFQAVLQKVVQNGTSVEMGRSSARPGGNRVPTLPLGPPAVNLHVTQQQVTLCEFCLIERNPTVVHQSRFGRPLLAPNHLLSQRTIHKNQTLNKWLLMSHVKDPWGT